MAADAVEFSAKRSGSPSLVIRSGIADGDRRTPAETMGLSDVGRLKAGGPADMVIFRARNYNELIPRPQSDRIVLRSGKPSTQRHQTIGSWTAS